MDGMFADKSKGCRFGSNTWCAAAANQIYRALLDLYWWIATGKVLIFYMDCTEAPSDFRVEIVETQ